MKKIIYTDFVSTEELVADLMEDRNIKKAITRSLGNGVMVIACENSIIAQELMLKKTQLLIKIKPYLDSLKIKVSDFRFDPKKW